MGKFVINKKANGEFRFNYIAEKENAVLFSKPFSTKTSCIKGIEFVQKQIVNSASILKHVAANGKFYFNIEDEKGNAIVRSNLYDTESQRDKEISVLRNVLPTANIDENITQEAKKPKVEVEKKHNEKKDEFQTPANSSKQKSHYRK